jgi:prepilin-type N-terminal cleavage/methylation domain-containing protein
MVRGNKQAGFGIVEVLVAVAVVAIILTAIAAGLAMSLKTTAELKFRSTALAKAQEVIEVARRERAIQGWDDFSTLFGGGAVGVYTYCLNTDDSLLSANFPPTEGACTDTVAWDGNDYIRELTLDATTVDQVTITVTVYWENRQKQIQSQQVLYNWI